MELLLEQLENLLGITESDPETDKKLMWILESSKARLKLLLGGIEPPEELNHIIIEVSVIRFNRIGSEGLTSHTVEGESQTWNDGDFSGFEDEIESFLDAQTETKKGRVRFL
ncbi:MAG: phage head-tail connector protein [Lachnospiraceae bacterium]|nr:phage head-tail connector protein [Lachnospiraceae bacterium]